MNRYAIFVGIGLLSATGGCTQVQNSTIAVGNRVSAEFSWWGASSMYRGAGMPYGLRRHFRCGYVQGYYDVCGGACGDVPLLPPQCYWGAKYQTGYGAECIDSWFSGYREGAVTALNDGALGSNQLPTSWSPALGVPHPGAVPPGSGATFPENLPGEPGEMIPVPPAEPSGAVEGDAPASSNGNSSRRDVLRRSPPTDLPPPVPRRIEEAAPVQSDPAPAVKGLPKLSQGVPGELPFALQSPSVLNPPSTADLPMPTPQVSPYEGGARRAFYVDEAESRVQPTALSRPDPWASPRSVSAPLFGSPPLPNCMPSPKPRRQALGHAMFGPPPLGPQD
jgi:hypothetical protein